jgi:hypothetical protein
MDYARIYQCLVERARTRILEGYQEKHHVVPKCLGGKDDPDNLVSLTAREHYLAHLLLVKIHPKNRKLVFAAALMCSSTSRLKRSRNRQYEWLKIRKINALKGRECTAEHREKLSAAKKGRSLSDSAKQKLSIANKGKKLSAETRAKMASSQKGRIISDEHRNKLSAASKGRPSFYGWITDGSINQRVPKTDPIPEGWRKGRFNPPTGPRKPPR